MENKLALLEKELIIVEQYSERLKALELEYHKKRKILDLELRAELKKLKETGRLGNGLYK